MKKNINEFMRKKYVGVDLFNDKIKAFEIKDNIYMDKTIEEVYPNILNDKDKSYWYNFKSMKQLLKYISKNTKKSFFSPILYLAIPFEITEPKDKKNIFDAASKSNWRKVYMIDNFLCSAVGSGVSVEEHKRKIFIYCINNLTYIGLIFAGSAFNVKILEKGYNELTETEIEKNIEEILNEVSVELPEQFTSFKLPKEDLDEIATGWKTEIENKIYLSIPSNLKNNFGLNIGKYQLIYLNYENSILEGLKKIILDFTK